MDIWLYKRYTYITVQSFIDILIHTHTCVFVCILIISPTDYLIHFLLECNSVRTHRKEWSEWASVWKGNMQQVRSETCLRWVRRLGCLFLGHQGPARLSHLRRGQSRYIKRKDKRQRKRIPSPLPFLREIFFFILELKDLSFGPVARVSVVKKVKCHLEGSNCLK